MTVQEVIGTVERFQGTLEQDLNSQSVPGPFEPVPEEITYRLRVPAQHLQRLLLFLDQPGMLQKVAFGQKVQPLFGDDNYVQLDATARLQKACKIAVQFILALVEEALLGSNVLDDNERCTCTERDSFRRCMLRKGHKEEDRSRCKFTPKGSLSIRTVEELIKDITMDDIKRLSGLDDTRVECGRENFQEMRDLTDEYCHSSSECKQLHDSINAVEAFYQSDYMRHLSRTSEFACSCLTCGFCGVDGVQCEHRDAHKGPCVDCTRGYAIIIRLKELHRAVKSDTSVARSLAEQNRIEDDERRIDECLRRLDVYRSHLARHTSEEEFESNRIANLMDNQAYIVSDYKCRILSCFYREGQQKFFGKKGTSCHGHMIITNCLAETEMKVANFVYMISDDSLQDSQHVISSKYELYKNHLPSHVEEVFYRSDGAGCSSTSLHFLIQPVVEMWTGIKEISTSHSPAGGGKTSLDGGFGRMTAMLHNGVHQGFSYHDAETIVANTERDGGGLAASTFAVFLPNREIKLRGKLPSDVCPKGVLRCEAQPDGSCLLFQHSGYGTGTKVFLDPKLMTINIRGGPEVPLLSLFEANNASEDLLETVFNRVLSFLPHDFPFPCTLQKGLEVYLSWTVLVSFAPKAECYSGRNNDKENLQTLLAAPGMGKGNAQQIQQNRLSRRKRKAIVEEGETRRLKKAAGLFLCDSKCPLTDRFCRGTFLSEANLQAHVASNKCDFPKGINARDPFALLATHPGASLAVHSRPNHLGGSNLFRPIQVAPVGSPGYALATDSTQGL